MAALDMEEQLAARRRMAAELQAQLQSRAETMAARPLRPPRTPACAKPSSRARVGAHHRPCTQLAWNPALLCILRLVRLSLLPGMRSVNLHAAGRTCVSTNLPLQRCPALQANHATYGYAAGCACVRNRPLMVMPVQTLTCWLLQMLERAAAEARARAAAARAECNPLNHPLVQGYLSKK